MNFHAFKTKVAAQFSRMQKHPLFRVDVDKDILWGTYLRSFPAGTDPLFRERTEHDCSCCKNFIRSIGNVVAVIDGKIESLWDIEIAEEPAYATVAGALSAAVHGARLSDLFLNDNRTAGTDKTFEELTFGAGIGGTNVKTWDHFCVNIPKEYVAKGADIPSKLAGPREAKNVLLRSLTEITQDAVDTVLELIAQNSLYRGEEHKFAVETFGRLRKQFAKLTTEREKDIFAWVKSAGVPASVAKIRNTSIGTLLVDLSDGRDMDSAVGAFERMVAPANYKRPTALVTKAMIEKAKATLADLGLTSALERRYATLHDITINNVLFADRSAKTRLGGADVFDDMAAEVSSSVKKLDKVEEVPIEKFLSDILPRAASIEVLLEGRHAHNFVSLIAPVDPTAGNLFKWGNNFSWSYAGEFADSIKERVKKAGGSVEGDLCCRLAWEYTDDLDFHMLEPDRYHIYFNNRRQLSPNGGMLDLDANGIDGARSDPAENIFYADRSRMREGTYTLWVNNYNRRSDGKGFEVEIEFDGEVHHFAYDKVLRAGDNVEVAKISYTRAKGFEVKPTLPSATSSKTIWGVSTNSFHKVRAVMLSPNFWDDRAVGNKHFFFMLDGCLNDGTARGFFNEFLKDDLNAHRKVFEIVGGKMKVEDSTDQLSGLGFSSTQRNAIVCKVSGAFTRMIKIVF